MATEPATVNAENQADFFGVEDKDRAETVNEFLNTMRTPRENMGDFSFPDDHDDDEPLTDDDAANISYLDYDEEHRSTALFLIGALDSGIGFVGSLVTGMDASRYQAFPGSKKPADFYVDATAAMVKKYQAKLSLEAMFITALMMVYAPSFATAMKDAKAAKAQRLKSQQNAAKEETINTPA